MTTEDLKRKMYSALAANKACVRHDKAPYVSLYEFEERMEEYLQGMRVDHLEHVKSLKQMLVDRTDELGTARLELAAMRKERDEIQGRLHAVDHAYHVQSTANTVAGEMLRKAMETIRRQQGFIRTLYTSRSKRRK